MIKEKEETEEDDKYELIFIAVNWFPDITEIVYLSHRFNEIFPDVGLPLDLEASSFDMPIYVDKIADADCRQESDTAITLCWRKRRYCRIELREIVNRFYETNTMKKDNSIFCFIFNDAYMTGYFSTNPAEIPMFTVRRGPADATIAMVLHELYIFCAHKIGLLESVDETSLSPSLECENKNCFMFHGTTALKMCDDCKARLLEKVKEIEKITEKVFHE